MTKHEEALKKLKPGDRVRVMRAVPTDDEGWDNSWEPEMTRQIGNVLTIKECIGRSGVRFEGVPNGYPAHVLMPEHSLSGYFQKGDRVRVREKCKDYEHGWMQVWNKYGGAPKMAVGVIGTIVDILGKTGVQLDNGCFFPEWTLDHAPAEGAGVLVPVFKDGDTVRILRKPSRIDWGAVWTTHVDRTIGETGKIVARYGTKGAKDDRYCVLLSSNGRYSYPPEVLELVPAEEAAPKAPEPKTPKLEFKDGDDGLYDYQRTLAAAIAKLAANGTLRPITLSNIPRSTTSQESTMSNIRIETHTFVNGVKVQDLSQDTIVDIITGAERELAKMKSVNTQTRALKAKIAKLEGEIAHLVELSDERYAKENPGEAPGTSADV